LTSLRLGGIGVGEGGVVNGSEVRQTQSLRLKITEKLK
jgi:hypothetical protein